MMKILEKMRIYPLVSANIANGHLCLLAFFLNILRQLFSAFFCQFRKYQTDDFSIVGRYDENLRKDADLSSFQKIYSQTQVRVRR